MVLIPFGRGEQGLTAGQVSATHQAELLKLAQVAVDGGQPHGPGPSTQAGMQLLARQLPAGRAQFGQQGFLSGEQVGCR